jgi:hypothetical protein
MSRAFQQNAFQQGAFQKSILGQATDWFVRVLRRARR